MIGSFVNFEFFVNLKFVTHHVDSKPIFVAEKFDSTYCRLFSKDTIKPRSNDLLIVRFPSVVSKRNSPTPLCMCNDLKPIQIRASWPTLPKCGQEKVAQSRERFPRVYVVGRGKAGRMRWELGQVCFPAKRWPLSCTHGGSKPLRIESELVGLSVRKW